MLVGMVSRPKKKNRKKTESNNNNNKNNRKTKQQVTKRGVHALLLAILWLQGGVKRENGELTIDEQST